MYSHSMLSDQHAPGDDQYGYEDAGERWMPVHTVESIVTISIHGQNIGRLILDFDS